MRTIFFPQLHKFAVGVYAFQINKQVPISCKDLTWKGDQLIAFPSSQEQQMLHALCKYRSLTRIDDWIKPAWQKKNTTELWELLPRSKAAQQDPACQQHCCMTLEMTHFLSVQFRRHPLLRLGASCRFSTIPRQKWMAIQFPI